jgi:hypothetical protein
VLHVQVFGGKGMFTSYMYLCLLLV